jgi:hypothetical protein
MTSPLFTCLVLSSIAIEPVPSRIKRKTTIPFTPMLLESSNLQKRFWSTISFKCSLNSIRFKHQAILLDFYLEIGLLFRGKGSMEYLL